MLADGTVLKGRGHSAAGHGVDPFQIPLQQVLPVHGNKQIPYKLRLRLRGVLGDLGPGKGVIQGLLVQEALYYALAWTQVQARA